jgi:hypothetical protein
VPADASRFDRFRAAVLEDPLLARQLKAIDDWDQFTVHAVEAARERGLELSTEDIDAERGRAQLGWLTRWA